MQKSNNERKKEESNITHDIKELGTLVTAAMQTVNSLQQGYCDRKQSDEIIQEFDALTAAVFKELVNRHNKRKAEPRWKRLKNK